MRLGKLLTRLGRHIWPYAYYDPSEMAPVIAAGEPVLFFTQVSLDGGHGGTAVLTPTALILNSAIQPRDIDHTELVLRLPLEDIQHVSLERANLFERLMLVGAPVEILQVTTRDGRTRRLFFYPRGAEVKQVAVAMRDAMARALADRHARM